MKIVIPTEIDDELARHLDQPGEQAAFIGAVEVADDLVGSGILLVHEAMLDAGSKLHIALSDSGRDRVMRWANDTGFALVEIHRHGGRWPARMSPFDLENLPEWVRHVQWRLQSVSYTALVVGDGSIDGLVWRFPAAEPIVPAEIIRSDTRWTPTGLSARSVTGGDRGREV